MSKQFKVFTRGNEGNLLEWVREFTISFSETGHCECMLYHEFGHKEFYQAPALVMLRDLKDLENIPDEVQCVVCDVATEGLCEGDIIEAISYGHVGVGVLIYTQEDDLPFWMIKGAAVLGRVVINKCRKLGHILTHRIIKVGEVVAR